MIRPVVEKKSVSYIEQKKGKRGGNSSEKKQIETSVKHL